MQTERDNTGRKVRYAGKFGVIVAHEIVPCQAPAAGGCAAGGYALTKSVYLVRIGDRTYRVPPQKLELA